MPDLNLKGEVCPYTFVKTKQALKDLPSGEILRVIVDYLPAVDSVPLTVHDDGHTVLGITQLNDTDWCIEVRRS